MTTALLSLLLLAQAPGPVAVERLPFDPLALPKVEKAEVRVTEDGKAVTYSGVPLAAILDPKAKDAPAMAGLRSLSDAVLLVRATDGYQVAYSAVAVAMDPRGERYLLANARDGQPLGEAQGPVRMVVPGDPKHAQWVRNVAEVRLVRLDRLATGR